MTLIAGPVNLATPDRVSRIDVVSAQDMYQESLDHARNSDIFIATAAVADYRPSSPAREKIKKKDDTLSIHLTKNPDIVAAVAQLSPKPFTIGFAAETQNLINYAEKKISQKNLDMIIANDVSGTDKGFGAEDNEVFIIDKNGDSQKLRLESKIKIARKIIDRIINLI